jgi:hypothetical protein
MGHEELGIQLRSPSSYLVSWNTILRFSVLSLQITCASIAVVLGRSICQSYEQAEGHPDVHR